MAHKYIPVSLTAKGKTCLVVGGGTVALRKIENLMDYDIPITVVAPALDDKITYYGERKLVTVQKREYKVGEASSYDLVIAASDNESVNKQVYDDCQSSRAICNVVDNPPLCDFIFPAIVRRHALSVAVSTDGHAPFLAGHLRLILENIFPKHWERLMDLAGDFRKQVQTRWAGDPEKRNACYERFLDADWKTMLKEKSEQEISDEIEHMLTF